MRGASLESIENYLPISDRLGTGGQPEAEHFASMASAGYDVVINLAMPGSADVWLEEGRLVVENGMIYVHLPVAWDAPTLVDVRRFFGLMEVFDDAKVFVHCAKNMRVSVLVFLYRVCRQHIPLDVAEADLLAIWQPHGVWRRLVETTMADPDLCRAVL